MPAKNGMKTAQRVESRSFEGETRDAVLDARTPRRMTMKENVILTIKLLTGLGLLGAAIWGVDLWTSAK